MNHVYGALVVLFSFLAGVGGGAIFHDNILNCCEPACPCVNCDCCDCCKCVNCDCDNCECCPCEPAEEKEEVCPCPQSGHRGCN